MKFLKKLLSQGWFIALVSILIISALGILAMLFGIRELLKEMRNEMAV